MAHLSSLGHPRAAGGPKKEDYNLSSAELVFGSALTLLGAFIAIPEPPLHNFVDHLRTPFPSNRRQVLYTQVAALIQPVYTGPYQVLRSSCFLYLKMAASRRWSC
jgi:hypothetical protein